LIGYESLFEVLIEANFSEALLTAGNLGTLLELPLPSMKWKGWPLDLDGQALSFMPVSATRVDGGVRIEMSVPVP